MLLLLFMLTASAPASTLDEALAAVATHPDVARAETLASAQQARASGANAWADPVLSGELSNANLGNPLLTHPMSGVQFRLSQRLDGAGRNALVREHEALRAEVARLDAGAALLRARVEVQRAWRMASHAHAMADVSEDYLARLAVLREIATQHYEMGHGGQSPLLRLAIVERTVDEDILEWRTIAQVHEAHLQMWTGSPVNVVDRPVAVPLLPGSLEATAGENPSWAGLGMAEKAAQVAAEREAREGRPSVTVWTGFRVRTEPTDGADLASLGVSMPVPVFSARRQNYAAQAWTDQALAHSHAQTALGLRIAEGVAAARYRWERAAERAQVYGDELVPAAEAARDATIIDYRDGRAAFADVLEAEVSVLQLRRVALAAATETLLQGVEVERLTGVSRRRAP